MLAQQKDLCYDSIVALWALFTGARGAYSIIIDDGWEPSQGRRGEIMKEGIHPAYYQAKVTCNCGNEFVTGSTKKEIHVEICSKCHPFYTGQQKATSARGRIDKFNRKYGLKSE